MKYQTLFFDLDDTLWAFSQNTCETFEEMYHKYGYDRYFESFPHFYDLYEAHNYYLWQDYGAGIISKEALNHQRFLYPLLEVGAGNSEAHAEELARDFADDFFAVITTKSGLMPYAREVLEYLAPRYHLYILSNGFKELQRRKMQSAGIEHYFKKIILSDDVGYLKPHPEIFRQALAIADTDAEAALMIGDNWENDIAGAYNAGIDQVFYNHTLRTGMRQFQSTYLITDLRELMQIL
ncbi:MAG: YjjG family noncanonical pyrimidine nucleotidase [Prevotellaceae bacterium]|nr:YjjG family noncanonical pyrimidine nucleotidase [Prevotellaceae bacterium]